MIYLNKVGYNVAHPEGFIIDRPHGSGDYLFLLFRSPMEIGSDDQPQVADKNTFIIYGRESKHYYRNNETTMIHDWFHFDGDGMDDFFQALHLPLDTIVHAPDPLYISRKVQELQMEHIHAGAHRDEIMDATIRCLFMKLSDIQNHVGLNEQSSKYYSEFIELRNEIYQSPNRLVSIDELAAKVNLSRSYFQRIYTDLFGISVHNDMINNRLEYSMYLLENTAYGISEVAHLCGYENDVHFMRQFKKKTGMTPSRFRSNKSQLPQKYK
ncbi:helix-turn-helix domain-containing protein [Gorillibacterium massiliense]|uniref:helix-turn-helix domain-containing protein n=1 Tax=Gorillibacterium massiliense TaxID=1280390 RepID=UPI0004B803A0|nr:AraC family transcriptional regulator [Gorillibacterium massiliense]